MHSPTGYYAHFIVTGDDYFFNWMVLPTYEV